MYSIKYRGRKIINILLLIVLTITMIVPITIVDLINDGIFAEASMTVGESGQLIPGHPKTSTSGILSKAFKYPPIRVSLYRNEKALLEEEGGKAKIVENMKWGYPEDLNGSLFFVIEDPITHIGSRPITVGKYNAGAKALDYYSSGNLVNNIIVMRGTKSSNGVYYDTIRNQGIEQFKNNWRSKAVKRTESIGTWAYICKKGSNGKYSVDSKINEIFNPENLDYNHLVEWSKEDQEVAYMRYLDMLLTLYSSAKDTNKEIWGQAIDDYLCGDNLMSSPICVCIDSAAIMTMNSEWYIFLPTIDFLHFTGGVERTFILDGEYWWTRQKVEPVTPGDTYGQILEATNLSIMSSPSFDRIIKYYCTKSNGFSFGATAFTRDPMKQLVNKAIWLTGTGSEVTTDYIEMFCLDSSGLYNRMYGYMLSPAPMKPGVGDICELKVEPRYKVVETETIGVPVVLTVGSGVEQNDLGSWEQIIANAKGRNMNFEIHIELEREENGVASVPSIDLNPVDLIWSPNELLEFIYGRYNYTVIDNTADILVGDRQMITFDYLAKLRIKLGDREWAGEDEDQAVFKIIGPKIGYTSKPEAYSELKNYGSGSNMSGNLSETWEAMAGVPSTEQLYFAAGGSEFIVDVTVEHVEDEVARRTYESRYTGVDCEFKQGDTAKPRSFPSPIGKGVGSVYWDPHVDSSFTITWSGLIPNKASAKTVNGSGDVSVTCKAIPDRTEYNTSKSEAQQYVQLVNGTEFTHLSVSDKIVRSKKAWGAKITTDRPIDPSDTYDSDSQWHEECSTNSEGEET